MRNLLFSKSQRKHYSDTVVRIGKNNLGFSLVELIIVIAIMAILAAASIPVVGAFIKKAEKSNDISLVKDILYAIDLANEADAFAGYRQTALGDIEYPIAFIVIGEGGTQVVTSSTSIKYDETPCDFQFKTINTFVKTGEWSQQCPNISSGSYTVKGDIYEVRSVQYEYCAAHTPENAFAETTEAQQKPCDYKHVGTKKNVFGDLYYCNGCDKEATEFVTIPIGSTIIPNEEIVCKRSPENTSICSAAYQNSYGTIDKNTVGTTDTNTEHAVYQALVDVFGDSWDMKLSYDKWNEEADYNYSTFYANADNLFEDIESLSGTVQKASAWREFLAKVGISISQEYNSDSEVLSAIATNVLTKYPNYSDWEAAWIVAGNAGTDTIYPFGFSASDGGMETYAACRKGYNSAFASYLEACGQTDYANVISAYRAVQEDYIENTLNTIGMSDLQMPATITQKSFYTDFVDMNTHNNHLYVQLLEYYSNDEKKATDALGDIEKYYKQYLTSDAYLENCKAFYDTMSTIVETKGVAESSGDYFNYYEGYINEIGSLYEVVADANKNGDLVIIVSLKDGKAVCTLSNAAADPRNN